MVAYCPGIVQEKIRAEVLIGTSIIGKTPFVRSFNVQQARTQVSTTFTLTMDVMAGVQFSPGEKLTIRAGTRGNLRDVFTGLVEKVTPKPSLGRPQYYTVTFSGRGALSVLENKKFSRRIPPNSDGVYCMITGGSSNAVSRLKTLDKKAVSGNQTVLSNSPSITRGTGENSGLIIHDKTSTSTSSKGGEVGSLSSPPSPPPDTSGTGSGLGVHDHSDMTKGGPAFGVYSPD